MGTRADFYVGRGESAEWLGSIAWDGYPDGIDDALLVAATEADFRAALAAFFVGRDDVTMPEAGWPWPWEDSGTTEYAYSFHDGAVRISSFGSGWLTGAEAAAVEEWPEDAQVFPDMSGAQNVASPGSVASGLMVVTVRTR